MLRQFFRIFTQCPLPVVYPIHPRTRERFREASLEADLEAAENVVLLPPIGYFDFLALLMQCAFVLMDSGGIQEEATAPNIRKKVFVLRESTERPEAVDAGYAEVVATEADGVLRRLRRFLEEGWSSDSPSPFGDGDAGRRVIGVLAGEETASS